MVIALAIPGLLELGVSVGVTPIGWVLDILLWEGVVIVEFCFFIARAGSGFLTTGAGGFYATVLDLGLATPLFLGFFLAAASASSLFFSALVKR